MLELKNISKVYKPKKGTITKALENISLSLQDKGMIFLVGKSGSGKSTLLNIIGGLDKVDSGEIIFNGKSINMLTDKEYDSYRNTYIGFIFQEFNVLEQYNVYENIELAIKLQKGKILKDEIDKLLDAVELSKLGNRKINELSGGQKQRVAVARALVKKPKIILADEPTGNLDSDSSKQIFSLLKNVSKEELVIVVSHDMESAKIYGDRIIEIQDGKIVNDNIKESIINEPKEMILKSTKLPFLYALKMAFYNIKNKKTKLIFTILLSSLALIFMGLTINFTIYSEAEIQSKIMSDNNHYVYSIKKYDVGTLGSSLQLNLNDDVSTIASKIEKPLNIAYQFYNNGEILNFEFGNNETDIFYYQSKISNLQFIELKDENIIKKLIGKVPNNIDEIVVNKYFADFIIKFGIMTNTNDLYFPENYNKIIMDGKYLKLGNNSVKIVGIIDDDNSIFEKFKNQKYSDNNSISDYFTEFYCGMASNIYVKDGLSNKIILLEESNNILKSAYITSSKDEFLNNLQLLNKKITYISKDGIQEKSSISKNELIISIETINKLTNSDFDNGLQNYLKNYKKNQNYDENELTSNYVYDYLKNSNILQEKLVFNYYATYQGVKKENLNIIGISLDNNNYISQELIANFNSSNKIISSIYIYDDNVNSLIKTFNDFPLITEKFSNQIVYSAQTLFSSDVLDIVSAFEGLLKYTMIASLIFTLFTILLFSNFIIVSISYCKKEIGIIRALGANKYDVLKIFVYEGIMIGILSWLLSIVGLFLSCNWLNSSIFKNYLYDINAIIVHPIVLLYLIIFIFLMVLIATVIPINRITKIKPIEAILNK